MLRSGDVSERDTRAAIYNTITPGYSPKRPQVYCNIFQPHPHPPPDHQTGDIEAECHCDQGGQGPGPGGGGHQLYKVQPGGHWLGVPVVIIR